MSAWIAAQHQYVLTSLEILSSTQHVLDEFVNGWRRERKLPLPVELDALQRSFRTLTKTFQQRAGASATHAGNIARQLDVLNNYDRDELVGVFSSRFETAVQRLEKSLKVIALELEYMNQRNNELRERIAVTNTDENTSRIFGHVSQSLDMVSYGYVPMETRTIGAVSIKELRMCRGEPVLFDEVKKHGELDDARIGFEKLQKALQGLNNFIAY